MEVAFLAGENICLEKHILSSELNRRFLAQRVEVRGDVDGRMSDVEINVSINVSLL